MEGKRLPIALSGASGMTMCIKCYGALVSSKIALTRGMEIFSFISTLSLG